MDQTTRPHHHLQGASMTLLFGNRIQVVELLVKCFTAQLCSRDKNTCCWRGTTQSLRL